MCSFDATTAPTKAPSNQVTFRPFESDVQLVGYSIPLWLIIIIALSVFFIICCVCAIWCCSCIRCCKKGRHKTVADKTQMEEKTIQSKVSESDDSDSGDSSEDDESDVIPQCTPQRMIGLSLAPPPAYRQIHPPVFHRQPYQQQQIPAIQNHPYQQQQMPAIQNHPYQQQQISAIQNHPYQQQHMLTIQNRPYQQDLYAIRTDSDYDDCTLAELSVGGIDVCSYAGKESIAKPDPSMYSLFEDGFKHGKSKQRRSSASMRQSSVRTQKSSKGNKLTLCIENKKGAEPGGFSRADVYRSNDDQPTRNRSSRLRTRKSLKGNELALCIENEKVMGSSSLSNIEEESIISVTPVNAADEASVRQTARDQSFRYSSSRHLKYPSGASTVSVNAFCVNDNSIRNERSKKSITSRNSRVARSHSNLNSTMAGRNNIMYSTPSKSKIANDDSRIETQELCSELDDEDSQATFKTITFVERLKKAAGKQPVKQKARCST